ncbi:MAG: hypothetical protein GEU91_05240 [Rhizobiales bacterium]|nr:hypothetical protein [Hyphomicrobiales bacterium]
MAKMPVRMPMSTGTNENASGTALPTRSVSAAPAGEDIAASKAPQVRARVKVFSINILPS